jgi:glutamate-ammonia-ligase adenylyltransferase
MKNPVWTKALKNCAAPTRAKHFLEQLASTAATSDFQQASPEQARIVAALFSGSNALGNLLVAHPDWLHCLAPESITHPRHKQGLRKEINAWLRSVLDARDFSTALARLRQFKQREMMRIAARDLARLGKLPEILQEISDVADVTLDSVWTICHLQLTQRHGSPWHQNPEGEWLRTAGSVIGLGKLGGQELNYSSDVDVVLVYSEEGKVFKEAPTATKTPVSALTNHQFFNRLAESFIAEVTRMTPEGMLHRIDLRLRPEGKGGPLTRSLSAYENYYAQWGQTWERMMLIKARPVAGDAVLGAEFLETIQPFRYPRSINESVVGEIVAIKTRIEKEVVKEGELERNVKLGRGGIREIEFIVQSLQLLHSGRQPFLQGAQTLPTLQKLAQYQLITQKESASLTDAYCFLRDVEHRLQMDENRQTHSIPADPAGQERLAKLMGLKSLKGFQIAYRAHTGNVRRSFDHILKVESSASDSSQSFPTHFEGAETEWKQFLAARDFKDTDKAFRTLREFVEGPGYIHVSARTSDLAFRLLALLFALCPIAGAGTKGRIGAGKGPLQESQPPLSDPDRVVMRLDAFIAAYGARATLFELWNSNPSIFQLLVLLLDRSEFLAELAIRTPDLVDELVSSDRLRERKSAEETLHDLRHGLNDENQHLWLRRYHQAELMRIGLRDILGLADFEQYLTELSALADACMQYALEVVMRRHKLKRPPFVVIGLGKLGGAEIDYGSDLDIVFVARLGEIDMTRLARLAVELMDLVSARTEQGMVFHTDARLRPDGEKGLLVNTLNAFEEYYRSRAHLWEIQSLTRTRPVAGHLQTGAEFQKLAATLTNFKQPTIPLAAFTPDWKQKIHQMRLRIEKERTPRGKDELAIKTGKGGLMDAEFIAQTLCLQNGWQEPNTLRALERGRAGKVLPRADNLIENYRHLRRVEGILRRWSYEGETVLPDDPAPYYRVSVRCGFENAEAFRQAIAQCRREIREIYLVIFCD